MTKLDELGRVCVCLHTRMAARAVTRAYNAALRPVGIEVTQLSLLASIAQGGSGSVSALAERLAFERTTLVRNLAHLEREGLVERLPPQGRAVNYRLTALGEARTEAALPLWRAAQNDVEAALGPDAWPDLRGRLRHLRKFAAARAGEACAESAARPVTR